MGRSGAAELDTVPRGASQASRWPFPIQLQSRRAGRMCSVSLPGDAEPILALDGAELRFAAPDGELGDGLIEIAVELPATRRGQRDAVEVGGVRLRLLDMT